MQTTCHLKQEAFDIHPNRSTPHQLQELVRQFQLPHQPHFLKQVHDSKIIEYKEPLKLNFSEQADACFTRSKNVVCAVMTADCLPVLLTDTSGSFVAAVHCGWRSLYASILNKTIEQINPSNKVLAWFGPCIQQAQYEVDTDFVNNYCQKHLKSSGAFTPIVNGKSHANLYQLAKQQLIENGIENVSASNECTFLDSNYYSWRKNQTTHRMATMIWIR